MFPYPPHEVEVIEATVVPNVELLPPARPWGFWMTLVWALAGSIVMVVTQTIGALPVLFMRAAGKRPEQLEALLAEAEFDGLVLSASTLFCTPAMALFAMGVAKLTRMPLRDYLGLVWPSWRAMAISLAVMLVYITAVDSANLLMGRPVVPEFMLKVYQTAGFAPLLLVVLVVAAPLWEELCFRGLLWRGWAASPLGPVGAALLSSLCWTALHIQYEWLDLAAIFAGGVVLGVVRWKSGSVLLTMLLHAVQNLVAFIETVVAVELLGK